MTLGLETGGQERLLVEFARHADRERFELLFLCLGRRGPIADELVRFGWPVLCLEQPPGLKPKLVFKLRRLFADLGLDVVHSHDDNPLLYCGLATKLAGIRWIHTQHHGKLHSLSHRQEFLVGLMGRLTSRFVCVSHDSARQMRIQGVPARKILTLWNGIDLARFSYSGPSIGGPAVTVARLSAEKGITYLLQAAAQVTARDSSFRLEIAGDGPCREDLWREAQTLGLGEHVRFLGPVSDVAALLARASVFVLPSLSEGVSLTLLEAMARGLPVVSTRVGGTPEVVEENVTGLLAPARDASALAEALDRVRSDPEMARDLGLAGRARVEAHFDVRRMTAAYERLYVHPNAAFTALAEQQNGGGR